MKIDFSKLEIIDPVKPINHWEIYSEEGEEYIFQAKYEQMNIGYIRIGILYPSKDITEVFEDWTDIQNNLDERINSEVINYTPFISYAFVEQRYRSNGIMGLMAIQADNFFKEKFNRPLICRDNSALPNTDSEWKNKKPSARRAGEKLEIDKKAYKIQHEDQMYWCLR